VGDVVIRQDGDWYRRDDAWIVVRPENARRLAEAIMELAELRRSPGLPCRPTDRTAARTAASIP